MLHGAVATQRYACSMLLRALICTAALIAALATPSLAAGGSFSVAQPSPATVVSVEPMFELAGVGIPTNELVAVHLSTDPTIDPLGALLFDAPGASPLSLSARSPTSTTWSGSVAKPLTPGVYYWQFAYRDIPCVDTDADPCAPPSNATCGLGRCLSDVMTFTVVADTTAPLISALGAKVRLVPTRLTFRVVEANTATVTLRVTRRGTLPWQKRLVQQRYDPAATYFAPWSPLKRGDYRYCATATDVAGNVSLTSCRTVHVI